MNMENHGRNNLVLLLDGVEQTTATEIVTAATGFDAGAHALHFNPFGETRRGAGYRVLSVQSSLDLRASADELDAFTGSIAPRYDRSQVVFQDGILISE